MRIEELFVQNVKNKLYCNKLYYIIVLLYFENLRVLILELKKLNLNFS